MLGLQDTKHSLDQPLTQGLCDVQKRPEANVNISASTKTPVPDNSNHNHPPSHLCFPAASRSPLRTEGTYGPNSPMLVDAMGKEVRRKKAVQHI